MTLGIEWDELTIPYPDPRNSEIAMELRPIAIAMCSSADSGRARREVDL